MSADAKITIKHEEEVEIVTDWGEKVVAITAATGKRR